VTTLKNSDARPKSWIVWMKSDVVGKMLFHATDLSASDLDRSSIAAPLDDGWKPAVVSKALTACQAVSEARSLESAGFFDVDGAWAWPQ